MLLIYSFPLSPCLAEGWMGMRLSRPSAAEQASLSPLEASIDDEKTEQFRQIRMLNEIGEPILAEQMLHQLQKIQVQWMVQNHSGRTTVHVHFHNPLSEGISIRTKENFIRGSLPSPYYTSTTITLVGKNKTLEYFRLTRAPHNIAGTHGISIPANGRSYLSFTIDTIQNIEKISEATFKIEACEIKIGDSVVNDIIFNLSNTLAGKNMRALFNENRELFILRSTADK